MRPEYLPRPYTWELYQKRSDPNNPYNLIEAARRVRALTEASQTTRAEEAPSTESSPPSGVSGAAPTSGPEDLGLAAEELQGLFEIVRYAQARTPATFVQESASGRERLRVALAHSRAFEERWRALRGATGPVLLFSVLAREEEQVGNAFTFVQGHLAFRPRADDPNQMGMLVGHLGNLEAGEAVLGYVVLPPAMNLTAPMDVYWNDRHLTVTFRP